MQPSKKYMFNSIKKLFSISKKSVTDDSSFSALTSGSNLTPLTGNANDATLLASNKNWVFVCVNAIAKTISGVPIRLRKYNTQGDDEIVDDHAIVSLIDKPNRFQTGKDFFYMITSHLELTGNAYILKDNETNPTELMPLIPSKVQIKYNKANPALVEYVHRNGSKAQTIPAEMIIHLKYPNPENVLKGKGTLQNVAEWVDVDSASTEFNRLFFQNGSSPSGVLSTEATDSKALKLAKEGWEMRYEGTLNAHKTAVLPKGAKYEPLTSPKDMQFGEADIRFRDKILSGFGVPKSVVGIVEDVNRANAEASMYAFMAFTIDPKMKQIVSYLTEVLIPAFGLKGYYFDFPNIIPDNEDLKLRQNQVALAGQAYGTINEIRSKEGLSPIDNGDYVYGGFATIPIGKPQEQAKQISGEPVHKKFNIHFRDLHQKENLTKSIFDKVADNLVQKTKDAINDEKHKKFITRVSAYESKFIKAVKEVDKEMKKMAIDNLDEVKAFGVWAERKALLNLDKVEKLFVGLTVGILQDLNKEEGQAQLELLEVTTPFNPMSEKIQKRITDVLKLTAQSYTDTTLKLLNAQLDEGVANGESMDKLTDRVADVFKLTDDYRAEQVAQTTVFAVANASAREAYKQSGVVKTVKWHTAEDELVCEFCGPMDGITVDVEEDFFKEGEIVQGRDGGKIGITDFNKADSTLHPNCRCFTLAEEIEVSKSIKTKDEQPKKKEVEDNEEVFLEKMLDILEKHD